MKNKKEYRSIRGKIPYSLTKLCPINLNSSQVYLVHGFHSPVFLQSYELEVFSNTTVGLIPACWVMARCWGGGYGL